MKVGDKVFYLSTAGKCAAVVSKTEGLSWPDDNGHWVEVTVTATKHQVYQRGQMVIASKRWILER